MIDLTQLVVFVTASLALNLTPGSDMMFCLGQGIKSGPKAGIAASFGIATGGFIHTILAAFGLAALLAAYPLAFELVRWAGVLYLVWLGVQAFRNPIGKLNAAQTEFGSSYRAWRDGIFVNLLNPKIAVFILAFVPQFVDPSRGSTILQFLVLGGILNIGGTIINGIVGGFSGSIGALLTGNRQVAQFYKYLSSAIFFSLAAKLAFDRR